MGENEDLITTPTNIINSNNVLRRKRKRVFVTLSSEERESQLKTLSEELESLLNYFYEVLQTNKPSLTAATVNCGSLNQRVAILLEESQLPLSKLVDHIKSQVGESVSVVKAVVLNVGQRVMYGVPDPDADILEDDNVLALWCWETRDIKLIPRLDRDILKIRRTCRRKIHERITAVSAMIMELNKSSQQVDNERDLHKASEKLSKVLAEADIRLLVQGLFQKHPIELSEKPEDKVVVKDFEKNIRECEKEKKRMERQLHKEKLQREKETKRLQEEAEKEEKRREREESEMRKLLKKQQEEAEKDQRRREKEEAEKKKQLTIKKQASIMERFLKRSKADLCHNDSLSSKVTGTDSPSTKCGNPSEAVTLLMDSAFSLEESVSVNDIFRSHLSSWRQVGQSLRLNRKLHWGIRKKPRTHLYKELKLSTSRGLVHDDECNMDKLGDAWEELSPGERSCVEEGSSYPSNIKSCRRKQLLQFDKCHRPAFYGIWPKKSTVVGPRCPLKKDPDLDYDVDSDEEWEEEEPGESLSDCDKEDEESTEAGCSKVEDEDEIDDGFFVPDGYLSENEGVQVDRMETDICAVEAGSSSSKQSAESAEYAMLQLQENLNNLTERALRKNQPLIILNFGHEKSSIHEHCISVSKLDQCFLALSMHVYPAGPPIEISISNLHGEDQEDYSNTKECATSVSVAPGIDDSDLPSIVSAIQACPHGINKVVETLQEKFPTTPKSQLRNKVREVSDFVDNRWQVKKNILDKLGLSPSPEKRGGRTKSIAAFFSKRCLPPAEKTISQKH